MSDISAKLRAKDVSGRGLSKEDFTTDLKARADVSKRYGKNAIFQGEVKPFFSLMSSPPTVTRSVGTAATVAAMFNGTVSSSIVSGSAIDQSRMQLLGSVYRKDTVNPRVVPEHITRSDGSKASTLSRIRFATDAPAFELCFSENNSTRLNLIVDGQLAFDRNPVQFGNTGNIRYFRVDFGTNVITFRKSDVGITVSSGGSGYAVGDVITLNGGTGSATGAPCTIMVTQVSSGAVTNASVLDPGAYTSLPTGTLTQTATTGTGTGFTMLANFFSRRHTTRKMRNIEILYTGNSSFYGIVTAAEDTVLPYRANPFCPTLVNVGDSISAGTYLGHAGGHPGYRIAKKLGMEDNVFISAQGGTGWDKDSGTALRWSHPTRVADLIALQGDIYLFMGSQNETTAATTLTAAVTSTINQIRASRPDCYIIGIGNIIGNSTVISSAIAAGFAAATVQDRTAFINNVSPIAWLNANFADLWTVTGDANHFAQEGMNYWADIAAQAVAEALVSLSQ